ncbi:hypothetical protein MYCTH_2303781 [Thermothelomyces thermophilus ATCC 42464]|uniref:Chloride channel protein n=1 Tax=Thermothelomyces thermophilus (strain ATCC 42464 / BCRC 31852 / DSM 1799) TaxID=573729 RepID=G2QDL7_THET4|nr:uncharacterized protein MYCTH_2303781 [Thermothelomyces thermophilus ATCC 42464]AEO57529.1 hypothetical protein MYCTH_2303781 [Thermothelomyces thermophilus ATCC 42464]
MAPTNAMNNWASSAGPSNSRPSRTSEDRGHGNAHSRPYEHGDDESDELDLLGDDPDPSNAAAADDGDPTAILRDDPLQTDLSSPLTFKRRQKQSHFLSQPGRILNRLVGRHYFSSSPRNSQDLPRPLPRTTRPATPGTTTDPSVNLNLNTLLPSNDNPDQTAAPHYKDLASAHPHHPHDWYAEGPGRRVGYEDLTAIDWIFEYTKERQRQRALRARTAALHVPLLGHLQRLLDASQVWVVLLLSGVAVGALAAAIDVATDWLGDVKYGFCSGDVDGGRFYLGRTACCLGYDEGSQCRGWRRWGQVLGAREGGATWFAEGAVYLCLAVTFALSSAVLVKEYGIYARHSGIPEIKTVLGGFVIRRFLGVWTLITKSLGLVLAVASGMWLGKEGPLVHVACCCANIFTKLFPSINNNEARKREVLSAAAASGISVAFGSPIGGVLFSLEQLSYYFPDKTMWQSFVCAMTAAMVLQAFDPFRSGKLVLYQVTYTSNWHGFELVPFVLLGVLGGVYGGLFIKANMAVARWRKSTPWLPGPVAQVVIVAILTALINYPNRYMRSQNSELVSDLFSQCSEMLDDQFGLCKTGAASAANILLLLLAAILSFGLAAVTFGLQIPAGIILPSMAIGALTGRAVGIIMEIWQTNHPKFIAFHSCEPDIPCITPGTYAIIGAAAALAGVTRLTVSIVVIMFELTGALTYVLPIMIAVMISKWVGDAFSRRGIYESWIHFDEYPFLDLSEETTPIPDMPASQIMTRVEDLVVLTATGHTIASLSSILDAHPYRGFPVVSDPRDAILLGYISRAELAYTLHAATRPPRSLPPETEAFFAHQPMADPRTTLDLRPWMDQTPLTLPSGCRLQLAVSYFQKLGLRYVLFVDRGVLQGLLTKKDVWYVLNGAEETRRTSGTAGAGDGGVGAGRGGAHLGLAREHGETEEEGEESAGLLRAVGLAEETGLASPGVDRGSIL